ncbi:MAG: hypothetical protein WCG85_28370, partial [Polyangia bacterium]
EQSRAKQTEIRAEKIRKATEDKAKKELAAKEAAKKQQAKKEQAAKEDYDKDMAEMANEDPSGLGKDDGVESDQEVFREQILTEPGRYLEAIDPQTYNEGIIQDIKRLNSVTILNKSSANLKNFKGYVDWLTDSGEVIGQTPFVIGGSVISGDSKIFSVNEGTLQSGTITTGVNKIKIHFTDLDVIEVQKPMVRGKEKVPASP